MTKKFDSFAIDYQVIVVDNVVGNGETDRRQRLESHFQHFPKDNY
jgi:hypothetical protein